MVIAKEGSGLKVLLTVDARLKGHFSRRKQTLIIDDPIVRIHDEGELANPLQPPGWRD